MVALMLLTVLELSLVSCPARAQLGLCRLSFALLPDSHPHAHVAKLSPVLPPRVADDPVRLCLGRHDLSCGLVDDGGFLLSPTDDADLVVDAGEGVGDGRGGGGGGGGGGGVGLVY